MGPRTARKDWLPLVEASTSPRMIDGWTIIILFLHLKCHDESVPMNALTYKTHFDRPLPTDCAQKPPHIKEGAQGEDRGLLQRYGCRIITTHTLEAPNRMFWPFRTRATLCLDA